VARTKSTEVAVRNLEIIEMAKSFPRRKVAETFGISQARVSQIVAEHHEATTIDEQRAQQSVQIEFAIEKLMEVLRQPVQIKVTPSGRPVYDLMMDEESGKLIPDLSKPIYDYSLPIESAKAISSIMDRQARLNALDLKKPKEKDESGEREGWIAEFQRLFAENKELRDRLGDRYYVEAEVIEPPPELASEQGDPAAHQGQP
jgi:hypothetical protein